MGLKRLYGLREMSINVPDQDVKALRGVVKQAVQLGILPSDAPAWFPKSDKGGEAQPSSEPKQKPKAKGDKGKKEKEPQKPPPVPLSPDAKAQIDRSASAWDQLGNVGAAPKKAAQPWKALQGTDFDATHADVGGDYGKDFPQFTEPKSAVAKVGKDAKPDDAVDWNSGAKKSGMLSRLFGKKKQDRFTDNPYEFEPEAPSAKKAQGPSKDAHARMKQLAHSDEPPPIPGGDKEDAVGDLKSFLGTHKGDRERGGQGAMDDLKWDLKRSKGKR